MGQQKLPAARLAYGAYRSVFRLVPNFIHKKGVLTDQDTFFSIFQSQPAQAPLPQIFLSLQLHIVIQGAGIL